MQTQFHEVIGLIPAAGQATRLQPLNCSKEIIPIHFPTYGNNTFSRPKVACEYLLEHLRKAGIKKIYLVVREGKGDILNYFGDGSTHDINITYLMMGLPYGPPFTLDQAYPFVTQSLVAFGFPDIIFDADEAFANLITKQRQTNADVALGLFPTDQSGTMDMVEVNNDFSVRKIVAKPSTTALHLTWGIAVWTPTFTHFMHSYLMSIQDRFAVDRGELHVGDVIQAAIDSGLNVMSIPVSNKPYIDIGIPENLEKVRAMKTGGR